MQRLSLSILFAAVLAGCSGGAATTPQVAAVPTTAPTTVATTGPGGNPTTAPTTVPTTAPTIAPSVAPTLAPTPSPTPTAVPLSARVMGGAPLSATASQLAAARRTAQAHTQAQGIANGLPILVESSGMIAAWAGDQTVWVTNAQTSQDIVETAGSITPSGSLSINNPGFTPLSCLASVSAVCIVHPTAFEFGTSATNGKPVGKQTLTIAYGDGTSGTMTDYVYDGWSLPCNSGWAYVAGVPVAQALKANSDVYADCVNAQIDFPKGAMLLGGPSQDQYGIYATIFPTFTAAPLLSSLTVVVPMATAVQGTVFALQTQDGGIAKVYIDTDSVPGLPTGTSTVGMALHAQANGSFAF